MKKISTYLKLLTVLGLMFFAQQSKAQCAPNFIYSLNANGNVTFTSTSTGVSSVTTNYYWGFGNGVNVNGINMITASTNYTANGTYVVTLFVVSTAPTCSNQVTYTISITNATTPTCNINANISTSQGANGLVNFTNSSTGTVVGTTYAWNYGDNSTGTAAAAPHTYSANGSYTVTLVANNNFTSSCVSTKTAVVVVNSYCTLLANYSYVQGSNGLVNFTSTSTGTNGSTFYKWRFGDNTSTNGNPTSHAYANGTYTAMLVISSGSINPTCKDSISQVITVTSATCNLNTNFTYSQGANGVVNFNNTSTGTTGSTTYTWSFGDNSNSNTASPAHTYSANGTYTVSMTANNNGTITCSGTKTAVVVVSSYCNLNAGFTYSLGANGLVNFFSTTTGTVPSTYYIWQFGTAPNGFGVNPTHTYPNGTYTVTLTASNASVFPACSDTISQVITVTSNTCVANANFTLVPSLTPQLWYAIPAATANIANASWSWGDASNSNTLFTSHSYSSAGTYTICLTVTVNCGAVATSCNSYAIYRGTQGSETMVQVNVISEEELLTGIKNTTANNANFSVFPNPNKGEFKISISGLNNTAVKLTVCDLLGKAVYEQKGESINGTFVKDLQLSELPNGVYFVNINNGDKTLTRKIMINK